MSNNNNNDLYYRIIMIYIIIDGMLYAFVHQLIATFPILCPLQQQQKQKSG